MRRLLLATMIAMSWAHPTRASTPAAMTVANLEHFCDSRVEQDQTICQYYILGLTDGVSVGEVIIGDKVHFCVPDVTPETLAKLVMKDVAKEVAAFPENRELPAPSLIGGVILRRVFWCPEAKWPPLGWP